MAVADPVLLNGGFVVDHGGDDVAVVGHRLLAHHDDIPMGDGCVDHRVAPHAQREQGASADQLGGQGQELLDVFLGWDWRAGGDGSQQGDQCPALGLRRG